MKRNKIAMILLSVAFGLSLCMTASGQERVAATGVIETTSGVLTGLTTGYGYAFLGIPYATAERFRQPVPSHWDGIHQCTRFSPKAFQVTSRPDECSEDCLSLNIYTPDLDGSLPVLIDIREVSDFPQRIDYVLDGLFGNVPGCRLLSEEAE